MPRILKGRKRWFVDNAPLGLTVTNLGSMGFFMGNRLMHGHFTVFARNKHVRVGTAMEGMRTGLDYLSHYGNEVWE